MILRPHIEVWRQDIVVVLRLIAALLIGIWILLLCLGKSGFIHLFLLSAIGVAFVDAVGVYRSRMTA